MSLVANTECAVCGQRIAGDDGAEWVLLNRYCVGNGTTRMSIQGVDQDDEYLWEMHPDDNDANEYASGFVLHWPVCVNQYIDARIAESRVLARERGWIK